LLQPKKHPPAIQIETLRANSKRIILFAKNRLIPLGSLLPATKSHKSKEIDPVSIWQSFVFFVAHFCNRSLASLNHREKT
jgi:hypothetical protein